MIEPHRLERSSHKRPCQLLGRDRPIWPLYLHGQPRRFDALGIQHRIEAGKESCDLAEVMQLSPARLCELPAPVEPYRRKKWRSKLCTPLRETPIQTE